LTEHVNRRATKHAYVMAKLFEYGVSIQSMAEIVYDQQHQYEERVTMAYSIEAVNKVLSKREVLHGLLVAFQLDKLADKGELDYPLQYLVEEDNGLFGVDETLASTVTGVYGSIAASNYGFLDKTKPGIIGVLNDGQKNGGKITTFLDDMIAAIVASAEGLVAHNISEGHEMVNTVDITK